MKTHDQSGDWPLFCQLMLILTLLATGCVADKEYRGTTLPPMAQFSDGGPPLDVTRAAIAANVHLQQALTNYCIESFKPSAGHQAEINLGIVEFKDDGTEWNPKQTDEVMDMIESTVKTNHGAVIVTFIHGWENNARVINQNLCCFRYVLENLSDHWIPDGRPVIGVYLAWHGESCSVPGLDYLTFWSRKAAAKRIGLSACMNVVEKLNTEYNELNDRTNFVTMVTVGHSFGGQMLFSAIRDTMLDKNASNDVLKVAARDQSNRPAALRKGIGDLCILVNPAFEVRQYEPFAEDLAKVERHGTYSSQQPLILATYASEGDWAMRGAFPFGRFFDGLFCHPSFFAAGPSDFFGLGHYCPQVTHTFDYTNAVVSQDTNDLCGCPSAMVLPPAEINNGVLALMAARVPARIRPNPAIPEAHALNPNWDDDFSPYAVVRTTANVIKDHNNIFNPILEGQICKMISETYAQSYALHVLRYGTSPDR